MRKLSTLFLLILAGWSAWSQTCIVNGSDYATNFIICANDPLTEIIEFAPTTRPNGYGTIFINGTDPVVDLTGKTVLVPPKITLVFTGNVDIDAETNFQTSSGGTQGNSEVQFGADGTVYKGNPGANGFEVLNGLIVTCSADPNPMECLEIQAFLPVELTAFRGETAGEDVRLEWITATELNNDYFAIEHSPDGVAFRTVGQVKGGGTSSETLAYTFTHRQPVAGPNYYRLKQVDFDGKFEFSELIAVEVAQRTGGIQLFPNPTVGSTLLRLDKTPKNTSFLLTNLLGQRIEREPLATDLGWEFDLSGLPAGVYLLRMEADGEVITRQIVKQ